VSWLLAVQCCIHPICKHAAEATTMPLQSACSRSRTAAAAEEEAGKEEEEDKVHLRCMA